MKRKFRGWIAVLAATTVFIGSMTACGTSKKQTKTKEEAFKPSLDTKKEVSLEIAGFLGNFEALDQVVNNFNEYYPNVTVSYEQTGDSRLAYYVQNNTSVDIFMTSDANVRYKDDAERYVGDSCLDLSKEDIDMSAIQDEMLDGGKVDGKLLRIPLAQNLSGMVVNKTLLEKEGLEVPTNYSEFLSVCEALKSKGYTPIQSAITHAGSDLITNMAMATIGCDKKLLSKLEKKDADVVDALEPAFQKLDELIQKGYIDANINNTYPEDNYDEAILKFFDGNVPFWLCNTENASGMKKRESKSAMFTEHPFECEFAYVPLGEKGVYAYVEPWYGFSINKNSDVLDYAVEFLRFLATEEQMNLMAEIKGMPSVTKKGNGDTKYLDVVNVKNAEKSYVNTGTIESGIRKNVADVANNYANGKYESIEEALTELKEGIF